MKIPPPAPLPPPKPSRLTAAWSRGGFQMTALMDDPVMQSSPSPLALFSRWAAFPQFRPSETESPSIQTCKSYYTPYTDTSAAYPQPLHNSTSFKPNGPPQILSSTIASDSRAEELGPRRARLSLAAAWKRKGGAGFMRFINPTV